jgi:hypothetical protein
MSKAISQSNTALSCALAIKPDDHRKDDYSREDASQDHLSNSKVKQTPEAVQHLNLTLVT